MEKEIWSHDFLGEEDELMDEDEDEETWEEWDDEDDEDFDDEWE